MRPAAFLTLALFATLPLGAQGNYEVQVYGSELVPPRQTMLELHSNFTIQGTKTVEDGVLPTRHAFHETVEITHGFSEWFETGLYLFTSRQPAAGWKVVGTHLRPRLSVPARFRWPVGVSLSGEIGYQRPLFSADTWTVELRPIVDKKFGRWYASFNPTLDRSLRGRASPSGFEFSPNLKVGCDVARRVSAGVEYYGALGPLTGFDPLREQQQQILPVIDLDLGENWEFNLGVGVGMTQATDHLLIKMIVGYRFGI